MRILTINGSPRINGVTDYALTIIENTIGYDSIRINIPCNISGCTNCRECKKSFTCCDATVENFVNKVIDSDAIIFGSPTYYGGITSQMKSFLTKLFYSHPKVLEHKVVATVVTSRRAGSVMALSEFNLPFLMHSCILIGSMYWNEIHGDNSLEASYDYEGVQTLVNLSSNIKIVANALKGVEFLNTNTIKHMNFISREYLKTLY